MKIYFFPNRVFSWIENKKKLTRISFLTHGYSVGVAVSYSRDFLICIKFCETMAIVLDPQVCFAWLYIKCLDLQYLPVYRNFSFTF